MGQCNHGVLGRVPDLCTEGRVFEPDYGKPQLLAKAVYRQLVQ